MSAPRQSIASKPQPKVLLSCLLIIVGVLLVFGQVSTFEFLNFDDNLYVTENAVVLSGLTRESVRWSFISTLGGHWHPLSWLSLMLDVTLFGPDPSAMHLVNLGFHVLNSVLLFFLVNRVTGHVSVALISALLFALHPLRIESVAWVSQRKDLLSLNLGLLSALLYLRWQDKRSSVLYGYSLVAFLLALLAKPTMITIPVLLVLLEVGRCLCRGQEFSPLLTLSYHRNKLPFVMIAFGVACLAIVSQAAGGGLRTFDDFSVLHRFEIAFTGYVTYLGKIFWPFQSSVFYPVVLFPAGLAFGCLLCLLILSVAFWNVRERYPELVLSWLWFLISLLPVIGFVMVGAQAVADRWTQLSHIGPLVGLTHLCMRTLPRLRVLPVCIVPLFALQTFYGLGTWKSSESLFARALELNPNNFLAHTNLGAAQLAPDQLRSRVHHFEEAVRLNPTYPEALNNLGMVRAQEGRFFEAKGYFEKALSLNPNLIAARSNLNQVDVDLRRQTEGDGGYQY